MVIPFALLLFHLTTTTCCTGLHRPARRRARFNSNSKIHYHFVSSPPGKSYPRRGAKERNELLPFFREVLQVAPAVRKGKVVYELRVRPRCNHAVHAIISGCAGRHWIWMCNYFPRIGWPVPSRVGFWPWLVSWVELARPRPCFLEASGNFHVARSDRLRLFSQQYNRNWILHVGCTQRGPCINYAILWPSKHSPRSAGWSCDVRKCMKFSGLFAGLNRWQNTQRMVWISIATPDRSWVEMLSSDKRLFSFTAEVNILLQKL